MPGSGDGQFVTVNSSQLFFCDELTGRLPDVCDELISDVKGIRHLLPKYK